MLLTEDIIMETMNMVHYYVYAAVFQLCVSWVRAVYAAVLDNMCLGKGT